MADVEAPPAKKPLGLMIAIALVSMGAGAGGAYAFLQRAPAAVAPAEGGEAAEAAEPEPPPSESEEFKERLLSLEPQILNIAGDGYARLLKLRVEFECESPEVRQEALDRAPQIRDTILTLVSSKRLADVTGFEGKTLLKDDLRDRVNQLLTTGSVQNVLFTEFVVQ